MECNDSIKKLYFTKAKKRCILDNRGGCSAVVFSSEDSPGRIS